AATRDAADSAQPGSHAGDRRESHPGLSRTSALRQQSPGKQPQQGNKIHQYRTPHHGVFLDTDHHFVACPVMADGGLVDHPDSPLPRAQPQPLQYRLAAAVTRLTAVAGTAAHRLYPEAIALQGEHAAALLDHRRAPTTASLSESAMRSAARGGISPTTVAR